MATKKIFHSRAPTRIDLAGGTLDIWPIYLFLRPAMTINLGIDLFAEATLEVGSASGAVTLATEDLKLEKTFDWKELLQDDFTPGPQLDLHAKLLRTFARERPGASLPELKLSTRARSPAGAGLGGSSTLSIAIVGALAAWATEKTLDPHTEGQRYIEVVRDVETTVIKVPAGLQDYYGAMYGGLQKIRWLAGAHERAEYAAPALGELQDRLLLFYSGQSRNSGINNWALFKSFIDNQGGVRGQFESITAATAKLDHALEERNWQAVGEAIAQEWSTRRGLAPGISTPEIDSIFEEAGRLGKVSGKICGAGGGGCFFLYLFENDPSKRAALKREIVEMATKKGVRPLPFTAVPHGLEVERRA